MRDEIQVLCLNDTWSFVPFNPLMNIIGRCWVYKTKHHVDGSVEQYKTRQLLKVLFDKKTLITLRLSVLLLSKRLSYQSFSLWFHMVGRFINSISIMVLNEVFIEEVYVKQPPGFVDSDLPSHVCWLLKSLYGLKQASRARYTHLSDFLLFLSFHASNVDILIYLVCQC